MLVTLIICCYNIASTRYNVFKLAMGKFHLYHFALIVQTLRSARVILKLRSLKYNRKKLSEINFKKWGKRSLRVTPSYRKKFCNETFFAFLPPFPEEKKMWCKGRRHTYSILLPRPSLNSPLCYRIYKQIIFAIDSH